MTQPLFMHTIRPALAGVSLFALAGCAGATPLPCNMACSAEQWAAQSKFELAPVAYAEIFGSQAHLAAVSVPGAVELAAPMREARR